MTEVKKVVRWGLYLGAGVAAIWIALRLVSDAIAPAQAVVPEPTATIAVNAPPPQVSITLAATPTPLPVSTPAPATAAPTADPECALYNANLDLLSPVVNRDAGLSSDFEPPDLETPSLLYRNSYIVPIKIRKAVVQPLKDMLAAANDFGLQIMAVSGYRSYEEQAVAYEKWQRQYPDRASTISAEPGHSEHQLGTAIDFSTSYMEEQYGQFFHTDFFKLPEGRWLYDNSPKYGFTLSYPAWAEQTTGYQWEPWHFRYVGVELAQYLFERQMTLSEYVARCAP